MGIATALFAIAAAAIATAWAWLGATVQMPPSPLGAGGKLYCVSYTPFRGAQTPLGPDVPVDPRQIDEDLAQLKHITDCVRTYSVDHGLDQIAGIAKRHGMKVLQGLWLSNLPELSRKQVGTAITLAQQFPDVIAAVIVGNEVLLRGEMAAPDLVRTIREVKAQVAMPVTYADVWEFWLRYRDVASVVDFVTIHILPYWEDFPIPARNAAAHVDAIHAQMVRAFPGKDVFVGEFGWPSAGRMREGALPSPVNQARSMHEVLDHAKRENYRVNLIEAYDQPWKRRLEGTVGGHWGLFDAYQREPKFAWGGLVSNHPHWPWQAAGGVGLATIILASALAVRRRIGTAVDTSCWLRIGTIAIVAGILIGWTVANVPVESLTVGDWLRNVAWAATALTSPVVVAVAAVSGVTAPCFAQMLGRAAHRPRELAALALGVLLIALAVLSVQAALGLVFDPRYRDFPFAPLTAATVPLLLLKKAKPAVKASLLARWKQRLQAPAAESAIAATLTASAVYIICNESLANWQAIWFSTALLALAFTLLQARGVPG